MATTSKFWNAGQFSASGESSDSDLEPSVSVEKVEVKAPVVANRWAAHGDDSSSDEDEKRLVKSAKEKQWGNLKQIIHSMNNHKNIDDFAELHSGLELLIRGIHKARMIVEKEGIPAFFISALVQLEDYINLKFSNKESLKKLTKAKSTSFNILRSKARKSLEEFRELIDAWRANPSAFPVESSVEGSSHFTGSSSYKSSSSESSSLSGDDTEDESDDDDEDDVPTSKEKGSGMSGSEFSSGEEWKSDHESFGSDSGQREAATEKGLKLWGKKESVKKKKSVAKGKKKPPTKAKTKIVVPEPQVTSRRAKVPLFQPDEKIDSKLINKKLKEIVAIRGRKGFDRSEQLRQLTELLSVSKAFAPEIQLECINHLVSVYFDANIGAFAAIPSSQWSEAYEHISTAVEILRDNPECYLPLLTFEETTQSRNLALISELEQEGATVIPSMNLMSAALAQQVPADDKSAKDLTKLRSNSDLILATYLERLDDELIKLMQLSNMFSDDYKQRLKQTVDMLALAWKALIYFKKGKNIECEKAISLRILEHFHFLNQNIADLMWTMVNRKFDSLTKEEIATRRYAPDNVVELLCRECLMNTNDQKIRVRVILYLAYNYCLKQRYHEARDLLQTGNLQELAMQCSVSTQVLYNRCLVQLGFSAFCLGLTTEAHASLSEVCNMGRYKELLAQGLSNVPRGIEKSPEQERLEKRRILPYHMHISADLVDTVHNICAMLMEVPLMAANSLDYSKRLVSRNFRKQLDMYEKQVFIAPPESVRETVLAATKALQNADWQTCCKFLMSLKFWEAFPNSASVKSKIQQRIKEEALRTYLYRYSCYYDSFNVKILAQMFSLPVSVTHSILSKMMIQASLSGCWDEAAECVLITRIEKSSLQHLALQLTEKLATSVEQLEQLSAYRNSKFILTQISQRDDRVRRYDDRWFDRRGYGGRDDWGGPGHGGYQRWDNTGGGNDYRQYRFPKHHTYMGDNRLDHRSRKRLQ